MQNWPTPKLLVLQLLVSLIFLIGLFNLVCPLSYSSYPLLCDQCRASLRKAIHRKFHKQYEKPWICISQHTGLRVFPANQATICRISHTAGYLPWEKSNNIPSKHDSPYSYHRLYTQLSLLQWKSIHVAQHMLIQQQKEGSTLHCCNTCKFKKITPSHDIFNLGLLNIILSNE